MSFLSHRFFCYSIVLSRNFTKKYTKQTIPGKYFDFWNGLDFDAWTKRKLDTPIKYNVRYCGRTLLLCEFVESVKALTSTSKLVLYTLQAYFYVTMVKKQKTPGKPFELQLLQNQFKSRAQKGVTMIIRGVVVQRK